MKRLGDKATVARAAIASLGLHGLGLAIFLGLATRPGPLAPATPLPRGSPHLAALALAPEPSETWVDSKSAELVDPPPAAPAPIEPETPKPIADVGNADRRPTTHERGLPRPPEASATNRGREGGRTVAPGWRRDASTMRAKLADGANVYQPSRQVTATLASSPQEVRQEPVVGDGDSARSHRPRAEEPAPPTPAPPLEAGDREEQRAPAAAPVLIAEGTRPAV